MSQEREPLLQNGGGGIAAAAKGSPALLPSLARSVLKFLMWAVFLTWATGIFFYPTKPTQAAFGQLTAVTKQSVFGNTGAVFLAFSAPILIIAALAYVYISAFPGDQVEKKKLRSLSFRLWTFPVLVDGPFGVVSAVEFIGIVLFILYLVFSMTYYMVDSVSFVSTFHAPVTKSCELILSVIGLRFGSVGLFCMTFLFLPVSRGSVILRLIDIPFEHATRYHVWLGHLTMALFTLHGLCYAISWSLAGRLIEEGAATARLSSRLFLLVRLTSGKRGSTLGRRVEGTDDFPDEDGLEQGSPASARRRDGRSLSVREGGSVFKT